MNTKQFGDANSLGHVVHRKKHLAGIGHRDHFVFDFQISFTAVYPTTVATEYSRMHHYDNSDFERMGLHNPIKYDVTKVTSYIRDI